MDWYDVLLAARKAASKDRILTSGKLAEASGLPARVASAWLGKFSRWGYVLRSGSQVVGIGRPVTEYRLTRWGMSFIRRAGVSVPPRRTAKAANPKNGGS